MKRQALYACSTCTPPGAEPAGICLACSYECHGSHRLFELYTKRYGRGRGSGRVGASQLPPLAPDKLLGIVKNTQPSVFSLDINPETLHFSFQEFPL